MIWQKPAEHKSKASAVEVQIANKSLKSTHFMKNTKNLSSVQCHYVIMLGQKYWGTWSENPQDAQMNGNRQPPSG